MFSINKNSSLMFSLLVFVSLKSFKQHHKLQHKLKGLNDRFEANPYRS